MLHKLQPASKGFLEPPHMVWMVSFDRRNNCRMQGARLTWTANFPCRKLGDRPMVAGTFGGFGRLKSETAVEPSTFRIYPLTGIPWKESEMVLSKAVQNESPG